MDQLSRAFMGIMAWALPVLIVVVVALPQMIRILREYERGVIFRLGKLIARQGPGPHLPHPARGPHGEDGPARGHHRCRPSRRS